MIRADWVSDNYFSVLGIKPVMGQTFVPPEKWDSRDDPPVIISYSMWQRRFGSDPAIVGKTVVINRRNAIIRGVAPKSFGGLQKGLMVTEIWLPVNAWVGAEGLQDRESREYDSLLGRLHPGASIEKARAELGTIAHRLALTYPVNSQGISYTVSSMENSFLGSLMLTLIFLSGPFLILIICCTNVSGMILAQAEGRRSEIAVRIALGSGRRRMLRQLMTENLLLAFFGAGLGLVFTYWLIGMQSVLLPPLPFSMRIDLRVDFPILLFTLVISIAALLLSGLAPVLQALKMEVTPSLKGKMSNTEGGKRGLGLRNVLVAGQVAISLTLLVATGLFMKSMLLSEQIDPGFDSQKKLLIVNTTPYMNYQESSQKFFIPVIEQIKAIPGVKEATYASHMLMSGSGDGSSCDVSIPGVEPPRGQNGFIVKRNSVGRDYFRTLGTDILRGRAFNQYDEFPGQRTVVISKTMAERFWPKADPIGAHLTVNGNAYQIVGLAQDSRPSGIHDALEPYIYFHYAQVPTGDGVIIVETAGNPLDLASAVKAKIRTVDKMAMINKPGTLKDIMSMVLYQDRILALLSGALGVLGIILAAMGLYAVVAYLARRRMNEIGIRMALGAQRGDISRLVVVKGFRMSLIGIAVGLLASYFVMRLISSMLYGVAPTDIWILTGSVIVVLAISLLASYIPARRAAKIDPIAALRYE